MPFDPYCFDRDVSDQYPYHLHVSNTFLWMFLGLLITFGVAMAGWMTGVSIVVYSAGGMLVTVVIQLVLVIALTWMMQHLTVQAAALCFIAYSVVTGLTVSVVFYEFELVSIVFVFLSSAAIFGVMGLYGQRTRQDLSWARPILLGGLVTVVLYGLLCLFLPGFGAFDVVMNFMALALFMAYAAYDMQMVGRYYDMYRYDPEMLEKAAIFSALQLYLDFINLFLRLMRYMGKRKR